MEALHLNTELKSIPYTVTKEKWKNGRWGKITGSKKTVHETHYKQQREGKKLHYQEQNVLLSVHKNTGKLTEESLAVVNNFLKKMNVLPLSADNFGAIRNTPVFVEMSGSSNNWLNEPMNVTTFNNLVKATVSA
eukprot:TRINITY_DN1743_c0_g1_i2.p1 TRINITY_DN1743_c0_g1~~TRINITY_DN1743_c0_g1_i2.p1  ORF type:complete len:134 (-),score=34.77 TRINITY_DN1743_c0_g1_i2:21-422(-)